MRPATYERLWVVFDDVRRYAPFERRSVLDERCAGDPGLRAEVEKLLEQDEGGGADFLDTPGPLNFKTYWPTADDDAIGRRVGPYEIQECLGAGGMGCVYLAARRKDYEQRVAIKWIKPGLDTEDVLRRFRDERQLLASLRHPHIAALLDGGTLGGRPYFVMEHIDGMPIDQFCNDRRLGIAERVRLFLVVCGAVQHAHQNLVLHRDLKPGNILVDAAGSPKLLDFGIAKMLSAEELPDARTRTGQQYATPEYASPEQLCGDALPNTASDVYSLGVILYQLLTGHRPHEANGRSALALARAVCEDEPTPPRRWRPDLPYDLEVVCLRCLHKEPLRRFPSVASLADELERCLAGRPIQSRAVGVWEQVVKWGRRRPSLAGLICVSILAVLGLLAVSLWYNRRLEGAVNTTTRAKNDLQQEKDRADANVLITLGLLENKLVGARKDDQKEWLGPQKRQELQEVLDRFQALRQINDDSPPLTQLRARAYGQMAAVQELLGEYGQAERSLEQALELLERMRRLEPGNPAYRHELADTFHALGRVRADARRAPEAEAAYREAIRLHEPLAAASGEAAYRDALAREFHNLGNLLARDPARQQEARSAYEEAIQLHECLAQERPESSYPAALALHRYKLRILEGAGLDEKEKNIRHRISALEELSARDPASPTHIHRLAKCYHELGKLLAVRAREALVAAGGRPGGRPAEVDATAREAEDAFQRAVELDERLARDNPSVLQYRRSLAQHYVNLGDLFLWTAGRPEKARTPYEMALVLFKELAAQDATYQGDLGCTYEKLGQMWLRLPEPDRSAADGHLEKAVTHLQIAVKEAPANCHYRKILGDATKALHE